MIKSFLFVCKTIKLFPLHKTFQQKNIKCAPLFYHEKQGAAYFYMSEITKKALILNKSADMKDDSCKSCPTLV